MATIAIASVSASAVQGTHVFHFCAPFGGWAPAWKLVFRRDGSMIGIAGVRDEQVLLRVIEAVE